MYFETVQHHGKIGDIHALETSALEYFLDAMFGHESLQFFLIDPVAPPPVPLGVLQQEFFFHRLGERIDGSAEPVFFVSQSFRLL